jgi:hypothetical protein
MASIFARFFGRTVSEAAAFGAGVALGPVLAPVVRELENSTWAAYPEKPPPAVTLALVVEQGQVDEDAARTWAKETGFGDDAFSALIDIANTGPGVAAAFDLWRRRKIDEAGFRRALKRQGIEPEWIDALWQIRQDVLDPADLARGIHRGLVPDPGLLEGTLPSGVGNVPAYPVYDIDAIAEAEAAGLDRDHLGVLVGLQGNPMGAHEAAEAQFRGILTRDDYLRAIAEGNTRNEWADAIFEQTRQIPTARDFLENALRGYRTLASALAGAARHGMSTADATMIYQNQGRPMAVRQITQALARGGTFKPEPGEITDPYDASIVEGNIKPAYYDLAKALRYTLPSPFVMRALTQAGTWSQAKAEQRLLDAGWIPQDAKEAAAAWAGGTTVATDPHVAKAQTQLWNTTHSSYRDNEAGETQARASLTTLGIDATAQDQIIALWNAEKALIRRELSPADLRKAYQKQDENVATGLAWTRADAVARLIELGYDSEDAENYLNIG